MTKKNDNFEIQALEVLLEAAKQRQLDSMKPKTKKTKKKPSWKARLRVFLKALLVLLEEQDQPKPLKVKGSALACAPVEIYNYEQPSEEELLEAFQQLTLDEPVVVEDPKTKVWSKKQ